MSTELQERYRTARVVGHFRAADPNDVRSCDCCGQGLWNVNTVQLASGDPVFLGNDCVERVGLSTPELKAWWAAKFAEQRHLAQRARREAAAAEERAKVNGMPQRDEVINYYLDAQHAWEARGGVGDVLQGGGQLYRNIFADWDHGVVEVGARLYHGGSVKAIRVEGAAEQMATFVRAPFRGIDDPATGLAYARALFDLDGNLLDARLVEGKFGMVWRIEGGGWFNPSKARDAATRRANNAKKGYYEGACKYVGAGNASRWWANTSEPPVVILDNGLLDELVPDR